MKSATTRSGNELGGIGDWIAAVIAWFAVILTSLAIVCFLLGPAE